MSTSSSATEPTGVTQRVLRFGELGLEMTTAIVGASMEPTIPAKSTVRLRSANGHLFSRPQGDAYHSATDWHLVDLIIGPVETTTRLDGLTEETA